MGERVVFEGTRCFWSTKNILDVTIVEHEGFGVLEIVAFDADLQVEAVRLYIDEETLGNVIDQHFVDRVFCFEREREIRLEGASSEEELMHRAVDQARIDYILNRLRVVEFSKEDRVISVEMCFDMVDKAQKTDGFGVDELVIVRPAGMHPYQNIIKLPKSIANLPFNVHRGPTTPTGRKAPTPRSLSCSGSSSPLARGLSGSLAKVKVLRHNTSFRSLKPMHPTASIQCRKHFHSRKNDHENSEQAQVHLPPIVLTEQRSSSSMGREHTRATISSYHTKNDAAGVNSFNSSAEFDRCPGNKHTESTSNHELHEHSVETTRITTAKTRRQSFLSRLSISLGIFNDPASIATSDGSVKVPNLLDGLLSSHNTLAFTSNCTPHKPSTVELPPIPIKTSAAANVATTSTLSSISHSRTWLLSFIGLPQQSSAAAQNHNQKHPNGNPSAQSITQSVAHGAARYHHASSSREFSGRTNSGPFTVLVSKELCTSAESCSGGGDTNLGHTTKKPSHSPSANVVSGLLLGVNKVAPGR